VIGLSKTIGLGPQYNKGLYYIIVPKTERRGRGCGEKEQKSYTNITKNNTTTVLRPFFQDHPGEPVPEENFWTLWCKGRLKEADTPTIWLGATPIGLTSAHLHHPSHIFYRPDALPAAQPTASKH